mmetsp:Transcript_43449/g.64442  ORF Transcript_43449/g.64442 Transcript_43449/m.64442 type:complete len:216 (+) Transcript_43449:335-982(+)
MQMAYEHTRRRALGRRLLVHVLVFCFCIGCRACHRGPKLGRQNRKHPCFNRVFHYKAHYLHAALLPKAMNTSESLSLQPRIESGFHQEDPIGLSQIDTTCPGSHTQQEDHRWRIILKISQGLCTLFHRHVSTQSAKLKIVLGELLLQELQRGRKLREDETLTSGFLISDAFQLVQQSLELACKHEVPILDDLLSSFLGFVIAIRIVLGVVILLRF